MQDNTKEALVSKMESRIEQSRLEIDKLKAKAREAKADARLKLNHEIEALEKKKIEVETKVKDLKAASDTAWEDLKAGAESAWKALSSSVSQASSRF
ncbi:MAG: hypothetical protein R3E82_11175 [Pseudomonadales bacterium]